MAFILPAFVVVGLIFIIWLIHKTKEYIWKLKEAEEAADTQSPDPAAGPGGDRLAKAAMPKPGDKTTKSGLGGKWRKKGWKELDSGSEGEKWVERGEGRAGDRYSRVGEWQGSRKYRSRDRGGARDRDWEDEGHREGGERGRYGRLDVNDHDDDNGHDQDRNRRRSHRYEESERRTSRRHRESDTLPMDEERSRPRSRHESRSGHRPHSPAPSHAPSRVSRKEKKNRAEEWIRNDNQYADGRHHSPDRRELAQHHEMRDGQGKGKGRAHEAYDYESEGRYIDTQQFNLMPPVALAPVVGREPAKLEVQMGPPGFKTPTSGTSVGVATAIISASAKGGSKPETPEGKPLQRTKTSRKPAPDSQTDTPTASTPVKKSSTPHEDVPAYMRARAISPPPILSPPLNPNLFFHTGPSAQLAPMSTYDSATDLESMISAQPTPIPGTGDAGDHGKMPSIPSTAEKLERSATAGPGRTVRKAQTPNVSRTPTRTKSHDPAAATPTTTPARTEALRTPVRRGTDGAKSISKATPTIRLIDSGRGSISRAGQTPNLSKTSGLTPKKYSKRLAPATTPSFTPETTRRVRAQRKDLKVRGKVDEILRESWSERAVVSTVDTPDDSDDEEEMEDVEDEEVAVLEETKPSSKVPKDEVEMAHIRAASPTSRPAAPGHMASPTKRMSVEAASPRKVGGTIPGVDSEDIRKLQGIDQRMALMKQLEERVRR